MKKGHRARDCKIDVLCNKCGQAGHHVSLCNVRNAQQVAPVAEFQFSPNGQDKTPIVTSPSSLHVGTGGRVALQTAGAVIRGVGEPYRVRVLFDAGSHRSFMYFQSCPTRAACQYQARMAGNQYLWPAF